MKYLVLVKQQNDDEYTIFLKTSSESHAWHVWAYQTHEWDNAIVIDTYIAKQYGVKIKK